VCINVECVTKRAEMINNRKDKMNYYLKRQGIDVQDRKQDGEHSTIQKASM
jgi:hypothetical protein